MQIRKSNLLNQEDSSANRTLFAFHTGCPNQILRQSDVVRRDICCITGHLNNQLALVVSSSTVDELQGNSDIDRSIDRLFHLNDSQKRVTIVNDLDRSSVGQLIALRDLVRRNALGVNDGSILQNGMLIIIAAISNACAAIVNIGKDNFDLLARLPGTSGTSVPGTLLLLSPPSQPASTPAAATARAAAPALLRKRRREIISSLIIKNLHIVLEVFPRSHFLPSGRKANLCSDSLYPPPHYICQEVLVFLWRLSA